MENLDLSVIIPNYNKRNFLEQCIYSVLNQTRIPNEIIVVDDCSTDESRNLIEKIAGNSPIVKPILLEQNGGVSHARKIGLNNSTSTYVTFLDSDDYYYNARKLEREMQLIAEAVDRYHSVAYSRTILVDIEGNAIKCRYNDIFRDNEFPTANCEIQMINMIYQRRLPRDYCISREFLKSIGAYCYPEDFYEDLDLLMRITTNSGLFIYTHEQGTAYRQTPSGLSRRSPKEHTYAIKTIKKRYVQNVLHLSIAEKIYFKMKRSINNIYNKVLDNLYGYYQKVRSNVN